MSSAADQQFLKQIRKLLPLDDESLTQLLDYAKSLSAGETAEHLKSVLGDSPQALEFISSFNAKRGHVPVIVAPALSIAPSANASRDNSDHGESRYSSVPKASPRKKKTKKGLHELPPVRQVEGPADGGYKKEELQEYMPQQRKQRQTHASTFALDSGSSSLQPSPLVRSRESSPRPAEQSATANKLPPSAAGRLISDAKPSKSQSKSKAAKVSIAGGTPMHGPSTALTDLENAIRELEIQTNPTLAPTAEQDAKRKCNCMATRHELLAAAPNCMNCGKIICVKEGLAPCTFCKSPLLSAHEVDSMLRVLKGERGQEKMAANNATHRKADVAATPRPFTNASAMPDVKTDKLSQAMQHRDKLLTYQAHNARRTRIHDEAADYETPTAGLNAWASPAERAAQLKKQQKVLREQEWNARPEWEKKRVVASIDLVGGKIVRRMAHVERPRSPETEISETEYELEEPKTRADQRTFGRNPLLGKLIKPVARVDANGRGPVAQVKQSSWRRVQDAQDDNEEWILDGRLPARVNATDEPDCG